MNARLFTQLKLPALALVVAIVMAGDVAAVPWTISKIADTGTGIPSGTGNFTLLEEPKLDSGDVGFRGEGSSGQRGIYTDISSVLARVADTGTAIPSGSGTFTDFFNPSFGGGKVAFPGFGGSGQSGIYTDVGGSLARLADESTAIPGGTGNFTSFGGAVSTDGTDVVFQGDGSSAQNGIYGDLGSGLAVLFDTSTGIPSGTGNFGGYSSVALSGGKVALVGTGSSSQEGVYSDASSSLSLVADKNTAIPGGTGSFTDFFADISFDAGDVVFGGTGSSAQEGIYTDAGGSLVAVADLTTTIPGGSGSFSSFGRPTIAGGDIGFTGFGSSGQNGIYSDVGGSLMKVIDLTDTLDGKTVTFLFTSTDALNGSQLAFRADFSDGSSGIFLATAVPEPGSAAIFLLGSVCLLASSGWRVRT